MRPTAISGLRLESILTSTPVVTAPIAIIMTPMMTNFRKLLLSERKNLGPAISPTAVTNIAVPRLDTKLNLVFNASLKSAISVSPIINDGILLAIIP